MPLNIILDLRESPDANILKDRAIVVNLLVGANRQPSPGRRDIPQTRSMDEDEVHQSRKHGAADEGSGRHPGELSARRHLDICAMMNSRPSSIAAKPLRA
jgi:hypothetical protein